jgi:hypothetical protein
VNRGLTDSPWDRARLAAVNTPVAGLLKNPSLMVYGFDSFEGLAEAFNDTHGKFAFSSQGVVTMVEDPRVKFFKGLFEQTLPGHSVPDHDIMVVYFDADPKIRDEILDDAL